MKQGKRIMKVVRSTVTMGLTSLIVVLLMANKTVLASNVEYLETLNAGAGIVIDATIDVNMEEVSKIKEQLEKEKAERESTLVVSTVNNYLNIREEPNEEATKVGRMYQYCGGEILDRQNGWTLLKSGELTGWAKDEYLLFGEDAQAVADEVGELIVTVEADALRIRKEPNTDNGFYATVRQGEVLEGIEVLDDWIGIEYDDKEAYVSAEHVSVSLKMPQGETLAEIEEREQELLRQKLALTTNLGAYPAQPGDLDLLASIIYCEARGESYEGKVAVGAVVMNRVRSSRFANTISEVIYSPGQFSPVLSGKFQEVLDAKSANAACYEAAQAALNGDTTVGTYLYFRRAGSKKGYILGNHVFY